MAVADELDVFGQNPRLSRLYTQLCFCFSLPNSDQDSQLEIARYLERGLERLSNSFPWIAGHVVCDTAGVYRIERHGKPLSLITQSLEDGLQSMNAYDEAGFPFYMLDESVVSTCKTLPGDSTGSAAVLLVKATFIRNGLLLNFDAQHNCMDLAGQCQIIRLLAKACCSLPFTPEEIFTGNLPRHNIIPDKRSLPISKSLNPVPQVSSAKYSSPTQASTNDAVWGYFLFPTSSLEGLKSLASQTKTTSFISTDDALSALIWQSVTRARLSGLRDDPTISETTFDRQVDARKALGIPAGYPGMVVHKAAVSMELAAVCEASLGVLASKLRDAIADPGEIARSVCESAEALRESTSRGETSGTEGDAARKAGISAADVKMSSWAKEKCCEFDFGGQLGRAAAVRRPRFPGWEGLAYLMPKARDGEIAVALCLKTETMERLKVDEGFVRFGRFVG